jgi:hypothetical protein
MKLYVAPDIYYKDIQGMVVILDMAKEEYFVLDPVATSMWTALIVSDDMDESLISLQDKFSVAQSRLRSDLEGFRRSCIDKGFLQKIKPAAVPCELNKVSDYPQTHLFLRAWWSLFRISRRLTNEGLSCAYNECAHLPIPDTTMHRIDDLLKRSLSAFAKAENIFLSRQAPKDCIPRSLALFRFLRSVGIPVEHCIGVRRYPFFAHAWVEYRGEVVHDNPFHKDMFTVLTRLEA